MLVLASVTGVQLSCIASPAPGSYIWSRDVMIPALDPDLKSDFQLLGDSGWYNFGSSKKGDCNTYMVIHAVNSFSPHLWIVLTDK